MKISIHLVNGVAIVSSTPSWLEWLVFGRRAEERFAVRVPALNGRGLWIFDHTGRPVSSDMALAIDTAIDNATSTPANAVRELRLD